jgi:hypothetical protein
MKLCQKLYSSEPFSKHPPHSLFYHIFCRQARTADPNLPTFSQHRDEMPVAGKLLTACADTAAADRTLRIADVAFPLLQDSSTN